MGTQIKWKGLDDGTIENCIIDVRSESVLVTSEISGPDLDICYKIRTDTHWKTNYCELFGHFGGVNFQFLFERDHLGTWIANGQPDNRFDQCDYVDISLTPFTNSLPINRLVLSEKEVREISVVYFDLMDRTIKPVKQCYTRLSANLYHYENVPNDFEADILVDDNGFVLDYPGLFTRQSDMQ
ncbi:putative glycolipid-binding domain-containing protein [Dyadobacter chenwenxiniae]|uniref:Glycolipid-binding domain-containing protein n=1 Tax=Dyadobacter chenwenxiniae TaxID=2906456 RepID=A0A9X1PMK5_9BACT|nr:putative glycolipid-binding domain-containing protein [Dyadobacter chenwenxiniae]MCF0063200.1 putative glycolipid-binding domain-containing protein [Dyadobacter chenwenxiniae]UON85420.1 putative glycolipid-binding domain-containing protein [Dyadobacter chenwenxiniae]